MSPEQARGDDELDARVDVYALGVIMYEATTGRVPFAGNNYLSVISQVLNEEPTPPREIRADLSEEFEAIVMRAMAKDRVERYASAADLMVDVTALLEDPARSTERAKIATPRKKPPGRTKSPLKIATWIALVTVVIAAVVTTVVMLFGGSAAVKKQTVIPVAPVPVPVVVDAAPPPVEIDAAPEAATMEVTIKTEPPGATVEIDGVDKGPAPVTARLVIHDHYTKVTASAAGYEDGELQFNLYTDKQQKTYTVKLKKIPKSNPPVPPRNVPPPPRNGSAGTGAPPSSKTGGELHGNPFKTDGSPPAKP
jgi:eukaryotic-like serine/threonine-protein kinase